MKREAKRKKRRRTSAWITAGAVAAVAVLIIVAIRQGSPPAQGPVGEPTGNTGVFLGDTAPDFSFRTIEGGKVRLSDLRGSPVVIGFMATWCSPCRIEASAIRKVQEKVPLRVIQINIDPRENERHQYNFKQNYGGSDWLMTLDPSGTIARPYQVRFLDTTVVLDPQGTIIYRDEGTPMDAGTLQKVLSSYAKTS